MNYSNNQTERLRLLSKTKGGHFVGFDSLRFLAALSVIFSHSFLIATGSENAEPLVRLLDCRQPLGLYGVFTFFAISGFLLARSLAYKPIAITYVVNRTLRILPAFVFCTLLTALIIGPVFSSVGMGAYFVNDGMLEFIKKSLNTLGDTPLPSVFGYADNEIGQTVNGSLWSLRYEALSYLFLLVAWTLLRSNGAVALGIAIFAAGTLTWRWAADIMPGIAYTLPYFGGGVVMSWLYARYGTNWTGAILSAIGLVISSLLGVQAIAFAAFGAYLVVFVGERFAWGASLIARTGDCSYGLYLFGWPVLQMVKQLTHTNSPVLLFVLAVPPTLLLAYVSCHWIERPTMGWRHSFAGRLTSNVNRVLDALGAGRSAAIRTAKVTFVLSALFVMTTQKQWYYFLESMFLIVGFTVALAAIVGLTVRAFRGSRIQ